MLLIDADRSEKFADAPAREGFFKRMSMALTPSSAMAPRPSVCSEIISHRQDLSVIFGETGFQ